MLEYKSSFKSRLLLTAMDTAFKMASVNNPYFLLLQTMAREFFALQDGIQRPGWARAILSIDKARNYAKAKQEKQEGSFLGKIKLAKEKIVGQAEQEVDEEALNFKVIEDVAVVWEKYKKELDDLASITSTMGQFEHPFLPLFSPVSLVHESRGPFLCLSTQSNRIFLGCRTSYLWPLF